MERYQALIDKLFQQKEQDATAPQLLATVQLLHAELLGTLQDKSQLGTSKVAVTMPVNFSFAEEVKRGTMEELPVEAIAYIEKEEPIHELTSSIADMASMEAQPGNEYAPQPYILKKPSVDDKHAVRKDHTPAQSSIFSAWETTDEAPTLIQHQNKEVHELITDVQESINDRLKEEKIELGSKLKESPIKDLRKGIGINDRFHFVNELFRGDEAMYERSIKTINAFNIFSEAEYWMSRELKLKLGWSDNSETVKHFYQLVRRRFS